MERFDESTGRDIQAYGWQYLVRCPRCARCATVVSHGKYAYQGPATLTCAGCGASQQTDDTSSHGAVVVSARCRCGRCGRSVSSSWKRRTTPPAWRTIPLKCRDCGAVTEAPVSVSRQNGAFDPWFGLPLWLQAPCCGDVLWAWNRGHLEFLRKYVTASLRERTPNRNSSMVSRLPRWIKIAKNRDEIARCIERLSAI